VKRALILCLLLAGCDWVQNAFINSIPLEGNGAQDVAVYIGVDGLALDTLREAMARGAFAGPEWKLAKFVGMFPGTSDASWTRMLRTERIPSYEFEYYDPKTDKVVNSGLAGVAMHVLPALSESISFEAPYLRAFDYRSNGYTHGLEAYRDPWVSLGETYDNLFFNLEGRAATGNAFTAYMIESDVLGHIATPEDCIRMTLMLAERIEQFRKAHPERIFHFTLFSDHGMDFSGIPAARLLDFNEELPKVGVVPVRSLRDHGPAGGVYAIPIVHTRVSYLALHSHEEQAAEVALRVSGMECVDFAAGPLDTPRDAPPSSQWYGVWALGRLAVSFGYIAATSTWLLPEGGEYARFGIHAGPGQVRDEDLFDATRHGKYPDLLYRLRTALSTLGVENPAQVLVSFRTGWGSVGFHLPGGLDAFAGGSHGAADDVSSLGVLLSDERDLPDAVRADSLLTLFPRLAERIRARGLTVLPGDPDAARPLR
jgi:hypothetical protein